MPNNSHEYHSSGVIGSDVPWLDCPASNALTWVITVIFLELSLGENQTFFKLPLGEGHPCLKLAFGEEQT